MRFCNHDEPKKLVQLLKIIEIAWLRCINLWPVVRAWYPFSLVHALMLFQKHQVNKDHILLWRVWTPSYCPWDAVMSIDLVTLGKSRHHRWSGLKFAFVYSPVLLQCLFNRPCRIAMALILLSYYCLVYMLKNQCQQLLLPEAWPRGATTAMSCQWSINRLGITQSVLAAFCKMISLANVQLAYLH